VSFALLAIVLAGTAVPIPRSSAGGKAGHVTLPPGVSHPLDGVGDSPVMPS